MLRGESTPGLQTSYEDVPVAQWDLIADGKYPLSAIYDAILNSEGALANAIADTGGHPFRDYLLSFTATMTSGDVLPSVDSDSNPIIGIFGSVFDATELTKVCTEQPLEVIRRWQAMRSYLKLEYYYYKLAGNQILHTRDAAIMQCCIYNRNAQLVALEANNDMLLPDSLTAALVAGALAFLGIDGSYRAMFDAATSAIRSGLTSAAGVAMPSPTMIEAVST